MKSQAHIELKKFDDELRLTLHLGRTILTSILITEQMRSCDHVPTTA